jgi:hypothetical protein
MADSSFYRDREKQALRIARDSTDRQLIKTFQVFDAKRNAKTDAIRRSLVETRKRVRRTVPAFCPKETAPTPKAEGSLVEGGL